MHDLDASVSMVKSFFLSGSTNTGADTRAYFKALKACSYASPHTNAVSF